MINTVLCDQVGTGPNNRLNEGGIETGEPERDEQNMIQSMKGVRYRSNPRLEQRSWERASGRGLDY